MGKERRRRGNFAMRQLETMDRGARADILAWIDDLLDAEKAAVVVSHDVEPFAERTGRAISLRGGRLAVDETLPADPQSRLDRLDQWARGDRP